MPGLVSGGAAAGRRLTGTAEGDARRLVRRAAGTLGVGLHGAAGGAAGGAAHGTAGGAAHGAAHGAGGAGRTVHGAAGDPRYPSPRELRKVLSFVLDLVLHLAIGVGIAAAMIRLGQPAVVGAVAGLVGFVVASAVHRIAVQRLTSATLGKAITGLRIIRDDTGGPATTGLLVMQWLFGVILIVAGLSS
ncbi:RDD family protein [Actinocatenispora sera]|uniref:RDD family protein n=1 Tax=Actinocatenispora sera TaxID=390989 RepID=UPI0033CCDDCB